MEQNIIAFTGTAEEDVRTYDTLKGAYCSYKAFQGRLWMELENFNINTDYFNQTHYFKALVKLEILRLGNLRDTSFVPNRKHGTYFPPEASFRVMVQNSTDKDGNVIINASEQSHGVYRRKRGTWGFNCSDNKRLDEDVLTPLFIIFSELDTELEKALARFDKSHDDYEKNKEQLKSFGLSISDAKNKITSNIIDKAL